MIVLVVIVANLAALSTANPLAPAIESLSIRQMPNCSGITIPERCTQAANDRTRILQEISNNTSPSDSFINYRILNYYLNITCSSECLTPMLRMYDCVNNEAQRNLTTNLICSQQEDGTFCPVKLLEELNATAGRLPACISGNSCPSSCQQSYEELRNRLGCCAASWYGSSNPFSSIFGGQNFVTCEVPLANPCTLASGAATICLNFLLIATVLAVALNDLVIE